ncbi:MAG TPA: hypothetical protein VKR43_18680 [Bryobacteraceae bacterium]|nr:hypothetical protein [Bryobacteraceae bacterium]
MRFRQIFIIIAIASSAIAFNGCAKPREPERASYVPLAEVEAAFGPLITAGNHPTLDQHGTGERVGLFRDASGELWGLPLTAASNGSVLACAPPLVRQGKVTDTFPAGSTIIGSTNEPTGWRGGTGDLELLLRDARGNIRWQAVRGAELTAGPVCWAPESPGPPQRLHYYRLVPGPSGPQ